MAGSITNGLNLIIAFFWRVAPNAFPVRPAHFQPQPPLRLAFSAPENRM